MATDSARPASSVQAVSRKAVENVITCIVDGLVSLEQATTPATVAAALMTILLRRIGDAREVERFACQCAVEFAPHTIAVPVADLAPPAHGWRCTTSCLTPCACGHPCGEHRIGECGLGIPGCTECHCAGFVEAVVEEIKPGERCRWCLDAKAALDPEGYCSDYCRREERGPF